MVPIEDLSVLLLAEEPTRNWTFMNVLEVMKFGAERNLGAHHLRQVCSRRPRVAPRSLGSFS